MDAQLFYINKNRSIVIVDGFYDDGNDDYTFDIEEKNFVFALLLDGKRCSSLSLTSLEQYACSIDGKLFNIEDKDFSESTRKLTISTDLFFFNIREDYLPLTGGVLVGDGEIFRLQSIIDNVSLRFILGDGFSEINSINEFGDFNRSIFLNPSNPSVVGIGTRNADGVNFLVSTFIIGSFTNNYSGALMFQADEISKAHIWVADDVLEYRVYGETFHRFYLDDRLAFTIDEDGNTITENRSIAKTLSLTDLPVFDDDLLAGAGGVLKDEFYSTDGGELRIKL